MKTPAPADIQFESVSVPEEVKQVLRRDSSPRYALVELEKPFHLNGRDFGFVVVPLKLTPESKFAQCGRAVLCQTKEEMEESAALLTAYAKGDMVVIQADGFGAVGFCTNLRKVITEHAAGKLTLPDGKTVGMAVEREIDEATGEVTVLREQKADTEAEARQIMGRWLAEYEAKKRQYFESVEQSKALPPAPARCDPLTEADRADIAKAETDVLRRRWKHCFEVFDQRRAGSHADIDECRKAYCLDLAEQGLNPLAVEPPSAKDDGFWKALLRAGNLATSAKKKSNLQVVDYLIAFNWKLGWCFLSEKELAEKVGSITKTTFTPGQIGKRRERLGLVAKHKPGPALKAG
jgi:hypothetical protein